MNHILLLGAGFSRNWGGWLAEELVGDLLGRIGDVPSVSRRLQNDRSFENVLADLTEEENRIRSPATKEALSIYQNAIRESFNEMNQAFAVRTSLNFCNDAASRVNTFLGAFNAIFTLNQDLLLELHYRLDLQNPHNWLGVCYPGAQPPPQWMTMDRMQLLREPWMTGILQDLDARSQPIYKLHGSVNWSTQENRELLVIGANKRAVIEASPILRFNSDEFKRRLAVPNTRLMVIGYSFHDDHIDDCIYEAFQRSGLSMFILDPQGYGVFDRDRHAQIRPPPHRMTEVPCIGISTRTLSATFNNDELERKKIYRFFKPLSVT